MKQIQLTPTIIVTDGFINIPNRSDAFRLNEATEEQLDAITERTAMGKYRSYTHSRSFHTPLSSIEDRILNSGFILYENRTRKPELNPNLIGVYQQQDYNKQVEKFMHWQERTIFDPVINILTNKNK